MRAPTPHKTHGDRGTLPVRANAADAPPAECPKSDREAFGRLYDCYYSRILNYLYRRTLNIAVAEDLTSNTFFKALRSLERYHDTGAFGAWLFRIATNEVRMYWRSRSRQLERTPEVQAELRRIHFALQERQTAGEVEARIQQFTELRRTLRALPERYQTVLVLRYFEGFSYEDIAEILHKKLGTIKSRIHRALKRLGREIERREGTSHHGRHSVGLEGERP
ncbi:hypothetical protein LCGC14_1973020 [marine sediment metagenome]|uniref:HTH luxR-type domain-containing protein n=1 Tax=marine sediment metagenome TaxID=412755 RepID=A0A0F9FB38_9ZZZZ